MKKGSKYLHDDRYTHADRAEIYENLVKNPKSTLASPEQYARIPLKGMPSPTGKVYHGDDILISDVDDIENRNKEMNEKAQTLVKKKYL